VDSKYGSTWGEWCSNEVHGLYGVGIWKNIKRGWEELSSHIGFEMGGDSKIQFWHALWCEDQALKTTFLDMFSIARFKDAIMADHLELSISRILLFS
jgi:hypothetical protein